MMAVGDITMWPDTKFIGLNNPKAGECLIVVFITFTVVDAVAAASAVECSKLRNTNITHKFIVCLLERIKILR